MKIKKVQLKDGRNVMLREAFPPDAAALNNLVSVIINSSDFTLTTPAELNLSVMDQENRIHQFQKGEGSIIFVAELDGQLIGTLDFKNNSKLRNKHWGEFGMGLRPEFRGLGLGRLLLQELLDWGKRNPHIEKICLGVFANNKAAIHLYKSMGFIVEGSWVKAIKLSPEEYADELRMYLLV